ncbi:hypothetical protein E2C01_004368 [Portunus trituberculatus]|uniref:Uncharacterized protein n=1 Tax=Portunus trituberculatus TaxID=210409 RepID=A0A5B7CTV5_PORTR|nr:hypothetical protein [Portunus trituberculatus]
MKTPFVPLRQGTHQKIAIITSFTGNVYQKSLSHAQERKCQYFKRLYVNIPNSPAITEDLEAHSHYNTQQIL